MRSHFKRVEMGVGEGIMFDSLQNCPEGSRSVSVFLRAQARWESDEGVPLPEEGICTMQKQ